MSSYKKWKDVTGYELTDQPQNNNLTYYEQELVERHYPARDVPTRGRLKKLEKDLKKYPHIPALHNYRVAFYSYLGQLEKALTYAWQMMKTFPNYFMGRIILVDLYLLEEDWESARQVLDPDLSFGQQMNQFGQAPPYHLVQYLSYCSYQGRMALVKDKDLSKAQQCLGYILSVDEEYAAAEQLGEDIVRFQIARMRGAFEERDEVTKRIQSRPLYDFPAFGLEDLQHPVMRDLLAYDEQSLPASVLDSIKALPRQTAMEDLTGLLAYATHFYKKDPEALEEWDAATMSYPIHVPAALAALSAKEALPEVLHFFRQGEEILNFWYADIFLDAWEDYLLCCAADPEGQSLLWAFLREREIYSWSKLAVYEALFQFANQQIDYWSTLVEQTVDLWQFFLDHREDEGLGDVLFLEGMLSRVAYLGSERLLSMLPALFEQQLVSSQMMGDLEETQTIYRLYFEPVQEYRRDKGLQTHYGNLQDYLSEEVERPRSFAPEEQDEMTRLGQEYAIEMMSRMLQAAEEEQMSHAEAPSAPAEPRRVEAKIGRNEPCPCGSGKKYKKCCGKK